jgi:hypothetical protein
MTSVVVWEDRSNLLQDILFFSVYWDPIVSPSPLVVSTLPSTSNYIHILSRLFPSFQFLLFNADTQQTFPNVTFVAEFYAPDYPLDTQITFFLTDNPEWVRQQQPLHAQLPYTSELQGTLYWRVWAPIAGPATTIVPTSYLPTNNHSEYLATVQQHLETRESTVYANPHTYSDELIGNWDSCAEAQILLVYLQCMRQPVSKVIELSRDITQRLQQGNLQSRRITPLQPWVQQLAIALVSRDFASIQSLLASDYEIVDTQYRWKVNTFFYRDRLHNDSGLLMRAAVGSGCPGIVELALLEEAIDPGAMDNIALQDALLSNKKAIAAMLAAAKTIDCPQIYNTAPTPWTAYEIFRTGANVLDPKYFNKYSATSKQLVTDPVFIEEYTAQPTAFRDALLATYQQTHNPAYYRILCECSNMKQRQSRHLW